MVESVQAQAGLNVVIQQFEDERGRLVILNNVATAPSFGAREARIIRADKIVQDSLDTYRMSMFGNSSAGTQSQVQPQGKVTPHPSFPNLFMDEDGTIFLDAMGAKPATPDDITTAKNALFPGI